MLREFKYLSVTIGERELEHSRRHVRVFLGLRRRHIAHLCQLQDEAGVGHKDRIGRLGISQQFRGKARLTDIFQIRVQSFPKHGIFVVPGGKRPVRLDAPTLPAQSFHDERITWRGGGAADGLQKR